VQYQKIDWDGVFKKCQSLAEQEYAAAQSSLGIHFHDQGVQKDEAHTFEYWSFTVIRLVQHMVSEEYIYGGGGAEGEGARVICVHTVT